MSRFPKALTIGGALAALALSAPLPARAEPLGLGRAATPAEIAAWDIDVRPDGLGLPEGSGDVATGEEVYTEKCAVCHGDFGEGAGRWPVLAGGRGTLTSDDPNKTIGSYWPYLSTVWDYVHRAMPFGEAQSLSDDEVYAITAYLLYLNDLVDDEFVLSRENFGEVRLPNEAGFMPDDRPESPLFGPREVCMSDCKAEVRITKRARVLDVTPEEDGVEEDDAEDAGAAKEEEIAAAAPKPEPEPELAKPAFDAALAEQGEQVFKKCRSCHQVGEGAKNRAGPVLTHVFGAPFGAVEGFKYSRALQEKADEGMVWDEATLDAFIESPRKWLKGTKMSYAGLRDADERRALIEYLKSVGP